MTLPFAARCCGTDFTERTEFAAHTKRRTGHRTTLRGWSGFQATKPLAEPKMQNLTEVEREWLGSWVTTTHGASGQVWSQAPANSVWIVVPGKKGNEAIRAEVKNLKHAVEPAVEADLFAVAA